uniref:Uncharacterized protein n=1 Tax=Manihot esculenta TaxID=3983 RepID=A0A251LQX6_MANES
MGSRSPWLISLSSDLCHDRCACMAGHPILNKIIDFEFCEWRSHGDCPGSPLAGVCFVPLSYFC